jgi:hypothetical protein
MPSPTKLQKGISWLCKKPSDVRLFSERIAAFRPSLPKKDDKKKYRKISLAHNNIKKCDLQYFAKFMKYYERESCR